MARSSKSTPARPPLEEASDPETSTARLNALLAGTRDPAVRDAIARNPGVDEATLLKLAPAHPLAVLANPQLALWAMGKDAVFRTWPDEVLIALLARPTRPHELAAWGANAPRGPLRYAYLLGTERGTHGRNPFEGEPGEARVAQVLSKGPPLEARFMAGAGPELILGLAWTPPEALEQFARSIHRHVEHVATLLANPNVTFAVVQAVLNTTWEESRLENIAPLALALPCVPADILREIALTEGGPFRIGPIRTEGVKAALARDLLTAEERAHLCRHPESFVRAAVAASGGADRPELLLLAGDPDPRVRLAVATNPRTDEAVLDLLQRAPEAPIAAAIASSTSAPRHLRQACLAHPRGPARRAAVLALDAQDLPATIADDEDGRVRLSAAKRADAPPALLERLARDVSPTVRRAIAKNPNTPAGALAALADDRSAAVREGLAKRRPPRKMGATP